MSRRQLLQVLVLVAAILGAGVLLGAAHWSHWGQLALAATAAAVASLGAPEYFAWREPRRRP